MTERICSGGAKNGDIVADSRSSLAEPKWGRFDHTYFLSFFCHLLPIHSVVILVGIHTSVTMEKSLNRWPPTWQNTGIWKDMPVAVMAYFDLNFIESIIVFFGTRKSNTLNLPHAIIRGCSALGNWNLEVTGWVKRAVPLRRSLGGKKNTSIVLEV